MAKNTHIGGIDVNRWKSLFSGVIGCILVICLIVFVMISGYMVTGYGEIYETDDPKNYGQFIGNFDNDTPTQFITAFFPAELQGEFSDITYHYKAKKGDTYSYEAYLEFVISDPSLYEQFLNHIVDIDKCVSFFYDDSFMEYTISNVYYIPIDTAEKNISENPPRIGMAKIGKILFSRTERRIIFVAIGHYDGGGTNVGELCFFFDRFGIDPIEYADHAFDTEYEQDQKTKGA